LKALKLYCKVQNKYDSTCQWSAAEVWSDPNKDHSESKVVDVFSFGMILWELETEEVPFEGLSVDEIRKKIVR
jgi:serine/threonine protein kinase